MSHLLRWGLAAFVGRQKIAHSGPAVPDRNLFQSDGFPGRSAVSVIGVAKGIDREYLL